MHPDVSNHNTPRQLKSDNPINSKTFIGLLLAIISAVIILLLILRLPGVVIGVAKTNFISQAEIREKIEISKSHNDALRDQIAIVEKLQTEGVCKKDNNLYEAPLDSQPGTSDELLKNMKPINQNDSKLVAPAPLDQLTADTKGSNGRIQKVSLPTLLDKSTVFVINIKDGRVFSFGTGFFIANDKIATNWHVVQGDNTDHLVINKSLGKLRVAKLIASTPAYSEVTPRPDFAILSIEPFSNASVLPLRKNVERLQRVVAAGFPYLVEQSDDKFKKLMSGDSQSVPELNLTNGNITVVQEKSDGLSLIVHGAQISPGNSGGPLVDECGAIVGVNTFVQSDDNHSTNVALSSDTLFKFLKEKNIASAIDTKSCDAGVSN